MASDTFQLEIDFLDKSHPQIVDILAVDRSILDDQDISFILDSLPAQTENQESLGPYIGIDLFYGKDSKVKGIAFVTQSRALVIRIPDNAAETAVARYENEMVGKPNDEPNSKPPTRVKGRYSEQVTTKKARHSRLRQLLNANLVAFGMGQITLTLWHTLRERVEGINLSTIISKPTSPPPRTVPDHNSPTDDSKSDQTEDGKLSHGNANTRGRGGRRGRGGQGDTAGGRRGGRGRGGQNDHQTEGRTNLPKKPIMRRVELPEDKENCWDRDILSPGEVTQILYPKVSRMDINALFIGQEEESDMVTRVAEAVSRAWIAYIVANDEKLNSAIREAPVIKPSRLNDEELTFFSKSMVAAWAVMGEGEAKRPIEREDMALGRTNEIVSQSHKKRIRASKYEEIWIRGNDGGQQTLYARRVFGNAKAVKLSEDELTSEKGKQGDAHQGENGAPNGRKNGRRQHVFKDLVGGPDAFNEGPPSGLEADSTEQALFDMENVHSFQVYGRAEATMPEKGRDMFILRLLEGRGSLRGPEYQDCEFIRRIWFPTQAQTETGKKRKAKNSPPTKERYGWVDGSWGDDSDDSESDPGLIDDDTEDDELGYDLPLCEVERHIPKFKKKINPSQLRVIGRVTAPNARGRTRATLVHGPPGTGKTRTITAAAVRLVKSREYVWIVAQSNVGIGNVADKLLDIDFKDFVLIVSEEHFTWTDKQYKKLMPYVVRTIHLQELAERFKGKRLVLCTLAGLSNPLVEDLVMYQHVPLRHLIIDEASQIDMTSQFMHVFFKHRYALKNVCWFGDPMQLPPYGWSETAKIDDIFKVEHLKANAKLMDTSYRLPVPIADFISKEVYNGKLKASPIHEVVEPTDAILFVDTPKGVEQGEPGGTSSLNEVEAEVVVRIVELYYHKGAGQEYDFDVITPYDAQRRLVEKMLKSRGIDKEVYNVDSFQGREADYIITTLTKTSFSSFLTSVNRLNVLLTRCKKGLIVVTQKEFVRRTGGLLLRLCWKYEDKDIWKDADDVINGYVNLPGSPAPFERPQEEFEEEGSESE